MLQALLCRLEEARCRVSCGVSRVRGGMDGSLDKINAVPCSDGALQHGTECCRVVATEAAKMRDGIWERGINYKVCGAVRPEIANSSLPAPHVYSESWIGIGLQEGLLTPET